jgi:hypothetical protein
MSRVKFLLLASIVCCLLPGCMIIYYPYFRNLTEMPVVIGLQTNAGPDAFKDKRIVYTDSIIDINRHTYKQLRDTLKLQQQSNSMFQVEVPPHSTVCMPVFIQVDPDYVVLLRSGPITDTIKVSELKARGVGTKYFHIDFTGKAGEDMYIYGN